MAGFLYFVPGARVGLKLSDLTAKGLGYAFDRTPTVCEVSNGPGGGAGAVVADGRRVAKVGNYTPEQVWRKVPGSEAGIWVGHYKAERPSPADLSRAKLLDGYPVMLGDGQQWRCPVAREPSGSPAVPQIVSLGDDGKWTHGDVVPAYAALWKLAQQFWDVKWAVTSEAEGDEARFDFDFCHNAAVRCLAANYAIGPTEASMLGLFTGSVAVEILEALIDWPRVLTLLKKTADQTPADSSTSDGPPADLPAIDPPSPTSGNSVGT